MSLLPKPSTGSQSVRNTPGNELLDHNIALGCSVQVITAQLYGR